MLPREGRRAETGEARSEDVTVTVGQDTQDPQRRIEALRRKLEFLELEIDTYEQAADTPATSADPVPSADVIELQHTVEERLADE